MDHEFVLVVLALLATGPLLLAAGTGRPAFHEKTTSASRLERERWRALWMPLRPILVVLCALGGWALLEPDNAEFLPATLLIAAAPFGAVWIRAVVRSVTSIVRARRVATAGTVGFLRPRVVLSPQFVETIRATALRAVRAHEQAHVCHRDPLRVWLAQFGADLQWPGRGVRLRFQHWRHALEIARDEEARLHGIEGADLADAVIAALRFASARQPRFVSVVGDPDLVYDRIARLLAPLPPDAGDNALRVRFHRSAIIGPPTAALMGARFGEAIVRALVSALS